MATTTDWKRRRKEEENRNEMRRQRTEQISKPVNEICEQLRKWGVKVGRRASSPEDRLCVIGTDRMLTDSEFDELHKLFGCTRAEINNIGKSLSDPFSIGFRFKD